MSTSMRNEVYWLAGLVAVLLAYWAYDSAVYEMEVLEDEAYELSSQLGR